MDVIEGVDELELELELGNTELIDLPEVDEEEESLHHVNRDQILGELEDIRRRGRHSRSWATRKEKQSATGF